MSDDDAIKERISNALSDILGSEGEMVTRWVALVETIDSDGERALWCQTAENAKPWDTLGMLMFAVQQEQAGAVETDEP